MTPLLVDDEVRAAIKQVIDYAEAHRINNHELQRCINEGIIAGDDLNRSIVIPFGYRCVFSIEEQPFGWTRHLSVSLIDVEDGRVVGPKKDRFPGKHAVRMIMDEFGMTKPFEHCHVYDDEAATCGAINIIEPMGDIDELRRTLAARQESQAYAHGSHGDRRHTPDRRSSTPGAAPSDGNSPEGR